MVFKKEWNIILVTFMIMKHTLLKLGFKLKIKNMNERQMFEKSFERPSNYFELSGERQWEIDKNLGILDWLGEGLSKEDIKRFKKHYKKCKN
jgi:hypothetical protein